MKKLVLHSEKADSEIPCLCRMCLSTDSTLEPLTSDELGDYFYQKIFEHTNVQLLPSEQCPSYLCTTCKSRLNDLFTFRWRCGRNVEMVNRFIAEPTNTHFIKCETNTDQPDDYTHATSGVESVWVKKESATTDSQRRKRTNGAGSVLVKKELATTDSVNGTQSNQQDSQQKTKTYDGSQHDDLFETEEQSLEISLKCEPEEPQQQPLQPSDVDLKHEHNTLETDLLHSNRQVEKEPLVAVTHFGNQHALNQTDVGDQEKSGLTGNKFISKIGQQQPSTSNEQRRSQNNLIKPESSGSTELDSNGSDNVNIKHKHQCPNCPAKFERSCKLKNHIRTHTGEKPFNCNICNKAFHAADNLKNHMKIHNKEDHHKCPHCPTRCVRLTEQFEPASRASQSTDESWKAFLERQAEVTQREEEVKKREEEVKKREEEAKKREEEVTQREAEREHPDICHLLLQLPADTVEKLDLLEAAAADKRCLEEVKKHVNNYFKLNRVSK